MAIKIHFKRKSHGVTWQSGRMYTFNYTAYENDPKPIFLFLYAYSGHHPNTGYQWRTLMGININYLPRKIRKKFIKDWAKVFSKNKKPQIQWQQLVTKYPYLKEFTRRFFYKPNYYIKNAQEIPFDDWNKMVGKSFAKDFSSKIMRKIKSKGRKWFGRGKK